MKPDIDEYEYLWDGSEPEWVLVRVSRTSPDAVATVIYNTKTRMALIIEIDELAEAVQEKMLERKVRVLDSIPSDEFVP
ncbi:MAG TPA: hypothetical protein VER11_03025 [Polyangiaceae bacterium]|nr:hypothetical protein [Polyangiaceae bacterium]